MLFSRVPLRPWQWVGVLSCTYYCCCYILQTQIVILCRYVLGRKNLQEILVFYPIMQKKMVQVRRSQILVADTPLRFLVKICAGGEWKARCFAASACRASEDDYFAVHNGKLNVRLWNCMLIASPSIPDEHIRVHVSPKHRFTISRQITGLRFSWQRVETARPLAMPFYMFRSVVNPGYNHVTLCVVFCNSCLVIWL